jgi:hypothetical protein
MWSYYGAKTNLIGFYPKPKFDTVIEPFAGSARYSLKYFDRNIILIDKYKIVVAIWKWLQKCSPNDILKLPRNLTYNDRFEDINFSCEEERWFMGFIYGCGAERPRNYPTIRKTVDRPNHVNYNLGRIAKQLFKIKHWTIIEGDYLATPNCEATWFIDPPYQYGGAAYVMSNKFLNFSELADWCRSRKGQTIVCENTKADWMDFMPIKEQKGSRFKTTEAIWCNEMTVYNNIQTKLF